MSFVYCHIDIGFMSEIPIFSRKMENKLIRENQTENMNYIQSILLYNEEYLIHINFNYINSQNNREFIQYI